MTSFRSVGRPALALLAVPTALGFTDLEIDPDIPRDVFEVATVVPSWL